MPPEMNFENRPETNAGIDFNQSTPKARPPSVYKMRCPNCQKLYSVQSQVMLSASLPLQFQCQSCQTRFETPVLEMRDLYNETLTTYEITPLVPTAAFRAPVKPPEVTTREVTVHPIAEAACPKCRGMNAASATECKHCGIVFEKYAKTARAEKNEELGVRRELADLWTAILDDYSNQEKHDRFVEECYKSNALPFAAQKYSRILGAAPNEDIAKAMRRRIIGLSSFKTETATAASVRKEAAEADVAANFFRYLKVSHIVFMVGGALIAAGFLLPASRDLVGLGLAMILLAIGVVYFRPKS